MEQIPRGIARGEAVRVGVDLAKRVIQVHAVDAAGRVLTTRALPRDKFIAWCAQWPMPGAPAAECGATLLTFKAITRPAGLERAVP